ncbi:MAG: polysulfide reductase NrfD [Eggerthellaceae bacterium]|nr:polysulfide reductase NrfD [Eggerthellaceae bacterium]
MIGELAVFYLFLGGTGAGVFAVCALADLTFVRRAFGPAGHAQTPSVRPDVRTIDYGFVVGLILLAVGIVCLIIDLGRADRVLALLLHPTFSVMSVGAYVLLLLLAAGAFLTLTALLYFPELSRSLVSAVEIATVVLGVAAMAYTGILLATTGGVALWWSPFVPLLFSLSSTSAGIAVVLVVGAFAEDTLRLSVLSRHLVKIDAIIIVLEVLCAAAFIWESTRDANPGTAAGLAILLHGEAALAWWLGFGVVGLAVPLIAEALHVRLGMPSRRTLAFAAVLVLVGAFCLRWSVVDAGVLREIVLEDPGVAYPFWN